MFFVPRYPSLFIATKVAGVANGTLKRRCVGSGSFGAAAVLRPPLSAAGMAAPGK